METRQEKGELLVCSTARFFDYIKYKITRTPIHQFFCYSKELVYGSVNDLRCFYFTIIIPVFPPPV